MGRERSVTLVLTAAAIVLLGGLAAPLAPRGTASSTDLGAGAAPSVGAPSANVDPMPAPLPFSTGMAASVALGVPNLTGAYRSPPTNASDFTALPEYAITDPAGNVWVTDWGASRVLEFRAPYRTGEAASVVLGQSTFTGNRSASTAVNLSSPAGLAMDASGDLWVADWGNQRVLEYVPPFRSGMAASLVLGQPNFTARTPGENASAFDDPVGLAFDPAGDLWVADRGNNRVLEFVPPFRSGMAAAAVLGQSGFGGTAAGTGPQNLSFPIDVAAAGSTLWVADELNDRVVGFVAPWTTGESAT
ncbi:NHL repeat containing protein, partial [mine drainage metagenome]